MPPATTPSLRWDLFCRVVDNHGDLGVGLRLARRLAQLGQTVRFWIDDPRALAWMLPRPTGPASTASTQASHDIEFHAWRAPAPNEPLGDVVVETFGGDLPDGWLERLVTNQPRPVWINLEHLSAQAYVERSHGLPSPQSKGPGAGLTRWFFYPGFTAQTGGLLTASFADTPTATTPHNMLSELNIEPATDATVLSLFGYAQPALAHAVRVWRAQPTCLLACPGPATDQLAALLGRAAEPGQSTRLDRLTVHWMPWLPQTAYDAVLACCDLNFVRGEDSFAQAVVAGRPFVWQAYPQADGAHARKIEAFLDLYVAQAPSTLGPALRRTFAQWNGLATVDGAAPNAWDPPAAHRASLWHRHAHRFAQGLAADRAERGDLGLQLYRFATSKR